MKIFKIACMLLLAGTLAISAMAETTVWEQTSAGEETSYTAQQEYAEDAEELPNYTAIQLATPTGIEWVTATTEKYPAGTLIFDPVPNCEGVYQYILMRDGEQIRTSTWSGVATQGKVRLDFVPVITESGTYTIKVMARGDGKNYSDSDWSAEASFVYKKPEKALGAVTNLQWGKEDPTEVSFKLPPSSGGCYVEVSRKNPESGEFGYPMAIWWSHTSEIDQDQTENVSHHMTESGVYRFRVTPLSYDVTQIANGAASEWSAEINFTNLLSELDSELSDDLAAVENGDMTAAQARDNLADKDTDYLASAVQANAEIYDKVANLEQAYNQEKGVKVDTSITDVSIKDVEVMGAGLNAAPGQTKVTLNVTRPAVAERELDPGLRSVLQVGMGLDGAVSTGKLAVPVCITMPQPENTFDLALRILHYHADGSVETIWPEFITQDGVRMVRFALTSFSDFVFAVENDTPKNGWYTENGQQVWYENGVKQGTTGRGKEIYDPASNAWYWLDAPGGVKAVSKDVYQESLAGPWGDKVNADGERVGKWVRYDANGQMIKGWQDTAAGRYYFDEIYGTMAKGFATIEGREYYFDPASGVLQYEVGPVPANGWKTIDGKDYWYENGSRQGYSVDASYRGKEIFDPGSNAWYWLDNVQGGAKAVSKDVYQESLAGPWGDKVGADGERVGKWVRYDENGHMIKGWQTTASGRYYFDQVYGTMAKGDAVIDGVSYKFDEHSGVLQ